MATQAFVKWVLGDEYSVRLRALRDMPREKKGLSLDFASLLGPAFYVLLFQLPAPAMLVMLVQEKENKILMRMKMQGMSPMAHYWGFYLWNLAIFVIFTIITLISGIAIYQLKFFTLSDIGLLLVFFSSTATYESGRWGGVGRQNTAPSPETDATNSLSTCKLCRSHLCSSCPTSSRRPRRPLLPKPVAHVGGYLCGTLFTL